MSLDPPAPFGSTLNSVLRAVAGMVDPPTAAGPKCPLIAEWSRPALAKERLVPTKLPTFRIALTLGQTAVTLNRSQSSSTCRALSFSARRLKSPLRSKIAYAKPLFICRDT